MLKKKILSITWAVVIAAHKQSKYSTVFTFPEMQHSLKNTVKVFPLPFWIAYVITCNMGKWDILWLAKFLLHNYSYLLRCPRVSIDVPKCAILLQSLCDIHHNHGDASVTLDDDYGNLVWGSCSFSFHFSQPLAIAMSAQFLVNGLPVKGQMRALWLCHLTVI